MAILPNEYALAGFHLASFTTHPI